jgi:hypothetical protein
MMLRALAAACALTLIVAPARAQSHPRTHATRHPHDSLAHAPMDSALHALLHGAWTGTLASPHGSGALRLSITQDSLQGAVVSVLSAAAGLSGNSPLAIRGDTLRWRQKLTDKTCPATAVLNKAKSGDQSLKGSLACDGGDLTFVLHKSGG